MFVYDSVPFRIAKYFAHHPGMTGGVTIAGLFAEIGASAGTAVHQRLTLDVERKGKADGFPLHRMTEDGVTVYWMDRRTASKLRVVVNRVERAHRARIARLAADRLVRAIRAERKAA